MFLFLNNNSLRELAFHFIILWCSYHVTYAHAQYSCRAQRRHEQSVTSRLETFLNFLRVSVSVSKILVSKKSLGIGLDEIFWSRHSVVFPGIFFSFGYFRVFRVFPGMWGIFGYFWVYPYIQGLFSNIQ